MVINRLFSFNIKSGSILLFFALQLTFFIIYFSLSHLMAEHNLLHPYLLFFGEKALLVLKGVPPRLENIGFIYPPLPVLIVLIFKANINLAQGFVASFISAIIARQVINDMKSPILSVTLIAYLLLSIPILFLATQRFDLYLHFFLIMYSIRLLHQYVKEDYSLYIFTAGPLFGLSFFTHFSSMYLIPWLFVVIFFLCRRDLRKFSAVSVVFFSPYILFLLSFAYLNWIFTGHAFGFLPHYRLLFANPDMDAVISAGSITGSARFMFSYLLKVLLIIIPFIAGIYYEKRLVSLIPFLVIFSLIYSNLFYPSLHIAAVFIMYFLIISSFDKRSYHNLLIAAMVVSIASSFILSSNSADLFERAFTKALRGGPDETTEVYKELEVYKQIADILKSTKGKILLDDESFFPVVYLIKDPDRFILPYQYEFTSALSNPALFAEYIVGFKDKDRDKVFQRFEHGVKGYYTIYDNRNIIMWGKSQLTEKPS